MKNSVRIIRDSKNITQEKLARIMDVSLSTIRNIESGRNLPNIEIVLKLKKALNCNIEDLFQLDE